ncbi:MAG: metallophosphoesterase [Actinobacteria bacterium]|nr:MAG: metallophosphoesterase [Actinomycetota bacterium]
MATEQPTGANARGHTPVRVAATGDVHCARERTKEVEAALADVSDRADMLLLAGDLTTHGEPDEAAALAAICHRLEIPVFAVLGNHDCHAGRPTEVIGRLEQGGIRVLGGDSATIKVAGQSVGIAGTKGFVGGFAGSSHLSDFGEPALRELYRLAGCEVEALDGALREIALCQIRIVLLHYSPTGDTLVGEPPGIWTFLGTDRLAAPIVEHEPDLVVHGHAHVGSFEGAVAGVPVYNVSIPVMRRGYHTFELSAQERTAATLR